MKIGDIEYQSLKGAVLDDEWRTRVELAALYRLVPLYGWDDESLTHITARVPGTDSFLLNPLGFLFEEITASSLVKIDIDGHILVDTPFEITVEGWYPMKAVHAARSDANYVMHTHDNFDIALSAQVDGLLPISQTACFAIADGIAYHDYEGVETYEEKIPSLQRSLGHANRLILRNHGMLTVGETAYQAFRRLYSLNKACKIQILAQAGCKELITIGQDLLDTFPQEVARKQGNVSWPGLLRKLDRLDPSYKE